MTDPFAGTDAFLGAFHDLVRLDADNVTTALDQLARDCRASARIHRQHSTTGFDAAAQTALKLDAMASGYEHAVSLLDLAASQAEARAQRAVTP